MVEIYLSLFPTVCKIECYTPTNALSMQ